MAHANIQGDLEADLAAIAEQAGCELVHIEYQGGTLRVFLDRPEGITIADCERVSREISPLLDVADFGKGRYTLEVSSPGLDRKLCRPRDYERFCGKRVRVTRIHPDTRCKETLVGRLEAFHGSEPDELSRITVSEMETGQRHDITLRDIQTARLEIEL